MRLIRLSIQTSDTSSIVALLRKIAIGRLRIVDEERHRTALSGRRFARIQSKYPLAFGVDLHVDDFEGVKMYGVEHGFRVVIVRPDDEHWAEIVLGAVDRTKSLDHGKSVKARLANTA